MQILINRLGVAAASHVILRGRGNNIETKGGKIRFAKSQENSTGVFNCLEMFNQ